jgi:hypothetical protein
MEKIKNHYEKMDGSEINYSLERMMNKFERLSVGYHASKKAPKTSNIPLINRFELGIETGMRAQYRERLNQVEKEMDAALEVAEENSISLDKDYMERSNQIWRDSGEFVREVSMDKVALVELAKNNLE